MSVESEVQPVRALEPKPACSSASSAEFSRRFCGAEANRDLKGRTIRGGAITITGQVTKFVLYTVSAVVLGRLLSPADYGLVGMVTAVTGFLRVFNYAGLSTATVQRTEITHELVSTVFWINMGLGVLMTLVAGVLAPAMVFFYREPRLFWITFAMASTFLIDAAGSQHLALLRRQMRFKALAVLDIVTMVVGVVVSTAAALANFGYWSLVLFQTVTALVPLVGAWLIEPWRPGFAYKSSGAGSMVRFGSFLTGTSLLNYLFRNIDNVLIGWRWGAVPLGFYQKAYSLLMLPVTQVNLPIASVAVSTLSRLGSNVERQRRYFVGGYSIASALTMPIVITAAIFAGDIIPLVLGNQWIASVRMFQSLAPAALIGALIGPLGWMFVATGRTDRQFRMMAVWTVLVILAFAVGLKYGPEGVALGYSAMALLLAGPICFYTIRETPIKLSDIVQALKYPVLASVISGGLGFLFMKNAAAWAHPSLRAVAGCGGVFAIYALLLLVVFRQWPFYRELMLHLSPARGGA